MTNVIQKMLSLSKQDFLVFLRLTLEDNNDELHFYRVLQGLDPQNQEQFYQYISEELAGYFREQLANLEVPTTEQIREAQEVLTRSLDNLQARIKELEEINLNYREVIRTHRNFMKECISGELGLTDQTKGLPIPPPQKEVAPGAPLIDLPDPATLKLVNPDIFYCIRERESRRKYTDEPLSLEELSYLLYTTQGVKKVFRQGQMTLRTVPSGGARHPFETYLAVNNVTSLTPGLYRYQPIEHKLTFLFTPEHMVEKLNEGALGQIFVGRSPVVFIWSVLPYRGEWRYSISAHKIMLLDAGHLCQNLYLACESLGLGTCAIGAYSQTLMDELLKLDGHDEFVIYLSPVGKLK